MSKKTFFKKAFSRISVFLVLFSQSPIAWLWSNVASATEPQTLTVKSSCGMEETNCFTSISAAITAASAAGDTINVAAGTYNENLTINKSIILKWAGSDTTFINVSAGTWINIVADNVTFEWFKIFHSSITSMSDIGILLNQADWCIIKNNNIYYNLVGIEILDSANNDVYGNTIDNNVFGIYFEGTTDTKWITQTIPETNNGPFYSLSVWNSIYWNTVSNSWKHPSKPNDTGFGVYIDAACENNTFTNNTIINNAWDGVYSWKADDNDFSGNTVTWNWAAGFQLMWSSDNNINWNTISSNTTYGLFIRAWALSSTNNTITDNTINNNILAGILLQDDITSNNYVGNVEWNIISWNKISGAANMITEASPVGVNYIAENNYRGQQVPDIAKFSLNVDYTPWYIDESMTNLEDGLTPTVTSISTDEAAKTITYNFSEAIQLMNADKTAIIPAEQYINSFKIYDAVAYLARGTYDPEPATATGVTVTNVVLSVDYKSVTITYTGSLIYKTNTQYVVDARGLNITDLVWNKMVADANQIFTVNGDSTKPVIQLNSPNPFTLEIHHNYTEAAIASDDRDGLVYVITSGVVNKDVVWTYTITYNAVDHAGNNATEVTRTVNVVDSVEAAFNGVSSTLLAEGIANNLYDITTDNITAFNGLYFEKSLIISGVNTKMGKITFTSPLDLSNTATQTFLQNLGTKLDMAGVWIIGLNFSGVTNDVVLKGKTAEIKFYGLDKLGFDATSTADEINSKLVAYDDDGALLNKWDLTSTAWTYLGACEVWWACYIFSIPVNHFTKYKVLEVTQMAQTTPNQSWNAISDPETPQVVVSNPTQVVNITVASGTSNASVDYGTLITGGAWDIPQTTIDSDGVDIYIPDTTVTSADSSWDGVLSAPSVTTVTLPPLDWYTNTLDTAIQLWFPSARLSFSNAVKIVFPGDAGKKIWYSVAGWAFTEITTMCIWTTQSEIDSFLSADSECKMDVWSDLIVWTKHFTKFATYTQTRNSNGGGGWSSKDYCPNWDTSSSFYDGTCGTLTVVEITSSWEVENNFLSDGMYSQEFRDAYTFAFSKGITTMTTIKDADMEGKLIRSHMAKMVVNYAINVLGKTLNTWAVCAFSDTANQSDEMKWYITKACQLGIMWIDTKMFAPNGIVTRDQLGTVISRLLYFTPESGSPYYLVHLNVLKDKWIITNTNPALVEKRAFLMLMLMRASK